MTRKIEAELNGKGLRVALVASRFNEAIVSRLVSGATDCLVRHGVEEKAITVVRVPGSFEIPQMVRRVVAAGKHDAVVALGVLIRGETPHFDIIAHEVARALGDVALAASMPVSFGVLTAETTDQALERAGGKMGNRGWDAALAAIEMARLGSELG